MIEVSRAIRNEVANAEAFEAKKAERTLADGGMGWESPKNRIYCIPKDILDGLAEYLQEQGQEVEGDDNKWDGGDELADYADDSRLDVFLRHFFTVVKTEDTYEVCVTVRVRANSEHEAEQAVDSILSGEDIEEYSIDSVSKE